jgi:hypothetical protein
MKETVHINNGRIHRCEHCGLATIEQYLILCPSLDSPQRELKQYLCFFCAKDLKDSGVQIRKVIEND